MYKEGFLSKNECVKAKAKILKTNEYAKTNCDNVTTKAQIAEKKKEQLAKQKANEDKKKLAKNKKSNNSILFSKKDNFDFDNSKEIWHAIIVHKGEKENDKINIYRSDINSKINTMDKAINNAKEKCWFDPIYSMSDWPSINCVLYYVANNKDYNEKFNLGKKLNYQIEKEKLSEEINFLKDTSILTDKGISQEFLGLEKKAYEFVLKKEQDRREELYAEACTGIIFGHKKGSKQWYDCLL